MPESTPTTPPALPRARGRWGRRLAVAFGIVLALVVALCFVATSGAFLKAVVLPRVGTALNAKVSATGLSLSPFSQLVVRGLRVETTGDSPLLTAEEARVRYDLLAIARGNLLVPEVTLVAPLVSIVQQADGRSNLDPLLGRPGKPAEPKPAKETKPLLVDLGKLSLSRGAVRFVKLNKDGSRQTSEVSNLELAVEGLKNGQPAKVTLGADLAHLMPPAPGRTNQPDQLRAKLSGGLELALDAKLFPSAAKGELRLAVDAAGGAYGDLRGLLAVLALDATATEVKQAALQFERGGQRLGQVRVSGPYDAAKREARLKLEVAAIDRNVLNLVGAARGLDFGETTVDATCALDITQAGGVLAGEGKLNVQRLSLRQVGWTTPVMDMVLEYQGSANLPSKAALLNRLAWRVRQGSADILKLALDRPLSVSWSGEAKAPEEATITAELANLRLGDWAVFLGTNAPAGRVSAQLRLNSQQAGRRLTAELTTDVQDLAASAGATRLEQAQGGLQLSGRLVDFAALTVDRFSATLSQRGNAVLAADGAASFDLKATNGQARVQARLNLPAALAMFPVTNLTASSGRVTLSGVFTQTNGAQQASATLGLGQFTGRYGEWQFRDSQVTLEAEALVQRPTVNLKRATVTLTQGAEAGGRLDLSGTYDLTTGVGEAQFNVANLNQAALSPFVAGALAPMALASVALDAKGAAHYAPTGASHAEVTLAASKLLLTDPQGKLPRTPLEARVELDVSQQGELVDLRKLTVALTPANPAMNFIQAQGRLQLTNQLGEFSFRVKDLNERGLGPLLGPLLAPNRLASVSLNAEGATRFNPQGQGYVQAKLGLSRLVVSDPDGRLPRAPLGAQLEVDIAQQKRAFDLRKVLLALSPTPRAKNQLSLQGKLDLSLSNAAPSQLSLSSEALDLTPFYDLLTTNKSAQASAKPPAAAPGAAAEPPPVKLPLERLTADLKLGQVYLRDLVISNWQAGLRINQGEVTLKPFQLALNGAPVSAAVVANLARTGYVYAVDLQAEKLALEPLANTFNPNKRDQAKGDIYARGHLEGAGVTGASLQKNLKGQLNFSLTNMNLQVVGPKLQRLLTPIAAIVQAPELLQTPLQAIVANAVIGNGNVDLQQFVAASAAFFATAQGTVRLAEVLTNSPLNLPVQLALRRNLAERARLVSADTPPDAYYAQLPQFVTVTGTVGNPKTETDKTKLGGQVLDTAGQLVGGKAGNILQGVGGLLKGGSPPAPGQPTNALTPPKPAPKTNAPPKLSPLDLLRGVLPPKN